MIKQGLARGVVNHRISRIKRMFKWAVAEELVPSAVFHGLQAVSGLRYGRSGPAKPSRSDRSPTSMSPSSCLSLRLTSRQ